MSITELRIRPARAAAAARWGLVCAIAGLVANVLLIVFFAFSAPYGLALAAVGWSGTANDVMVVVQFATFVPVAVWLGRYLPRGVFTRVATSVAVVAMTAVVALQLALVFDLLGFETQIGLLMPFLAVTFGWLVAVGSYAHRGRCLPRAVTRSGLLIGAAFLLGLVLLGAALLLPAASVARLVFMLPGIVLGAAGWLALPVWPLLLARRVFVGAGPAAQE